MALQFRCPLCGEPGVGSGEHVWPRWLRKYPAYSELRAQYKDVPLADAVFPVYGRDNQDRFYSTQQERGRVPLSPDVQVRVCTDCNSGWMAQLEEQAERILKPWIEAEPRRQALSKDDQALLGAWVMKTAATYSLYLPEHLRPFTQQQFLDLVQATRPPEWCLIWIAFSDHESAYVAAQLTPFWVGTPQAAEPETAPSAGSFYMGVHGVVLLAHFWQGPDEMAHVLTLPRRLKRGVQQVWPPGGRIRGPRRPISSQQLSHLRSYIQRLLDSIGIPTDGLTPEETIAAYEDFMKLSGRNADST